MTLAVLAVLAVSAATLARSFFWEWGPCPACKGRRGRGWGSTGGAWRDCGRCGGLGQRIRPLARIWPRHRKTARALKEARR